MRAAKISTPEAVDQLRERYEFREPKEVEEYLGRHPDLFDLLVEAAAAIPEFVTPDGPIILEVVQDPEDEEDQGELFAMIPTHREFAEVRAGMDRLLREWLIGAARHAVGRFNVGVEYR